MPIRADVMLGLLLLSIIPHDPVIVDHCDMIEVNHVYHDHCHQFTQVIFWDCSGDEPNVVAWRMIQRCAYPQRHEEGWCVTWFDATKLRCVIAPTMRETWATWDIEVEERERLPVKHRQGLTSERRASLP